MSVSPHPGAAGAATLLVAGCATDDSDDSGAATAPSGSHPGFPVTVPGKLGATTVMVSLVFQDVYLLDGTIDENIRFGRPGASLAEVRQAARRARVDTIAERLPDGWASRVGEGGRLLSGGERQRVAIARTLLKDTPIVLLDEATSALDAENEVAVHEALTELSAGRTLPVIAHRLATIAGADQIAVLDGGRITESGRHAGLLATGGRYAEFWAEHERARGWRLTS